MKTCYLHLGLHKTASSSFQQTCASNLKLLSNENLHYPIFSCSGAKPPRLKINNHSVPLRSLYEKNPSAYHINKRWKIKDIDSVNRDYQMQWDKLLNTDSSIILSGEGISLLPVVALDRLLNILESKGFVVKAIALVRSPLDYAHSIAQQLIRGGQHLEIVGFGELRKPKKMPRLTIPDGCTEIKNLLKVFGSKLVCTPFHQACQHDAGPVGYLLDQFCGCKTLSSYDFKRTQESKSNIWVRYHNQLNSRWPRFDQKKKLNANYIQVPDVFKSSGKFRLTHSEFDLLRTQIEVSNATMRSLLGDEFIAETDDLSDDLTRQELLDLMIDLAKLIA